jgi:hypothetical protein
MTAQAEMALRRIVQELPRFSYRFGDEVELHQGIAKVLTDAGIAFEREVVASKQDRFDFLCTGGVVIEAKVHGALMPAIDQCSRYAALPDVHSVVLATTRFWAGMRPLKADAQLNGKPILVVKLKGMSF